MTEKQKRQTKLLERMASEKWMLIWQKDIELENVWFIKYLLSNKPKPLDYQANWKDYTWLHCYK